jgi:nitrogenase molybdenum-cofactor synthesis protein NifE
MVALVREIDKALSNPVWEQVRTPAPWDEVSWEQRADEANAAEAAALASGASPAVEADHGNHVCVCKEVDEATIEDAIRAHRLTRVEEVRAHTGAAGGCGSCIPRVAGILARINGVEVSSSASAPANEVAAIAPSSPARGEGTPLRAAQPAPSPLAGEGGGEGCADTKPVNVNRAA